MNCFLESLACQGVCFPFDCCILAFLLSLHLPFSPSPSDSDQLCDANSNALATNQVNVHLSPEHRSAGNLTFLLGTSKELTVVPVEPSDVDITVNLKAHFAIKSTTAYVSAPPLQAYQHIPLVTPLRSPPHTHTHTHTHTARAHTPHAPHAHKHTPC